MQGVPTKLARSSQMLQSGAQMQLPASLHMQPLQQSGQGVPGENEGANVRLGDMGDIFGGGGTAGKIGITFMDHLINTPVNEIKGGPLRR
jgi:hypothetical protein